jgi:hypothetical protein
VRPTIRRLAFTAVATALAVVPSSAQKSGKPKAQYEMDVQTMSGMGMGAMMGGGLGGILGGGNSSNGTYLLDLRLTSATPAPVQPETGTHFFQPSAKMGKSVPLIGDVPSGTASPVPYEKPKGRLLMFWGCNAKAPKGQPFIIDLAKIAPDKMPHMGTMGEAYRNAAARDNNAAWWPNSKGGKQPKSGSSVRGAHRVTSSFTPEIQFSLMNDYMAALAVSPFDDGAAIGLGWNSIPDATGYFATAVGGMERAGQGGDMVIWTSANVRDFTEATGWLSPAEVQRQINAKNIMPPSQTNCTIPAEAKTAAGGVMVGSLNAFGPEENFSFPPKPTDPKAAWVIEWTAKARFRSFSSFMSGVGMGSARGLDPSTGEPKKKKACKGPMGIPIPGTSC